MITVGLKSQIKMPPKRREEKKEEEVVDESTLPPWLPFSVLVLYHPFIKQETREEFEKLCVADSKFAVVRRTDLETYATEFGLDTAPEVVIDEKFWAQVFRKKMYYLNIAGRRTK
jgi:hypothetical protein